MSWQRPNIGSRMNREVHVRLWERAEVKFLRATRQTPPFGDFGSYVRFARKRSSSHAGDHRYSPYGRYGKCRAGRRGGHTGLMLAARITLPHFWVSSARSLPKSDGDTPNGVPPKSAIRAFILESARPALISLLIFSMTSSGVPLGAPIPYHALTS